MIASLLFLSALVFIPHAGPFVDAYDLPKTAAVGILATAIWIDFYLRARDGERLTFPLVRPIVIFLALSAISGLAAVNTHYFLYAFGAELAGFTFFWHGANMANSKWRIANCKKALWLAPLVIVIAYALTPWLGIETTFGNQERGSALVALAVGVALWQTANGEWQIAKIGSASVVVLLLLFLWQAQMRSALAGLVIGTVLFLIARFSWIGIIIAAGALPLAIHLLPASFFAFAGDRPAMWQQALSLDWWPIGIGLGQWRLYAQAWIHLPEAGAVYWRELHNDYLQLLIEAGPLALAAWGYLLWRATRLRMANSEWRIEKQPLIIGLIAVLVNAFFLFPFQLSIEAAWFWLIAGVYRGHGELRIANRENKSSRSAIRNLQWLAPAVLLFVWACTATLHLAAELKLNQKDAVGAAAIYPWDYKYSMILGVGNLQRGNLGSAARRFEDVLSLALRHVAALNNLAITLVLAGHKKEAARLLLNALALAPDDPLVRTNLAIITGRARGKYELALVGS